MLNTWTLTGLGEMDSSPPLLRIQDYVAKMETGRGSILRVPIPGATPAQNRRLP
jgi:hypothetical protein